jgi:hypothetical protein
MRVRTLLPVAAVAVAAVVGLRWYLADCCAPAPIILPDEAAELRTPGVVRVQAGRPTTGLFVAPGVLVVPARLADGAARVVAIRDGDTVAARRRPGTPDSQLALFDLEPFPGEEPAPLAPEASVAAGDAGHVSGFPDGAGGGAGPWRRIPARVVQPPGQGGTSRLFVVALDAYEDWTGAAFLDAAGRVQGVLVERLMGSPGHWVVADLSRVLPAAAPPGR